jgi:hypothetical protein
MLLFEETFEFFFYVKLETPLHIYSLTLIFIICKINMFYILCHIRRITIWDIFRHPNNKL